jgi:PIN domain nuclease of toxin-antitoxin system
VLDTHVWVWAVEGLVRPLGRGGARAIEAAAQAGVLYVSAVSAWELITLIRRGRLTLARDARDWIAEARRPYRTTIAPVTAEIAMDAADLPAFQLGDPADRMIVATARALGGDLVTADRRLLAYGREGHVRVRPAGLSRR